MKPILIIKSVDTTDCETKRIYNYVKSTVDSFNAYVSDFLESISITVEKIDHPADMPRQDDNELKERVFYLNTRITELVSSMKSIAAQMPSLVEYRENRADSQNDAH
jgi:Mg2+ and Co2+ transporter CorA